MECYHLFPHALQSNKAQRAKNQHSKGTKFKSVKHIVLSNSSNLEDPAYVDHSLGEEELVIQEDITALQNVYSAFPLPHLKTRTAPGISKVYLQ